MQRIALNEKHFYWNYCTQKKLKLTKAEQEENSRIQGRSENLKHDYDQNYQLEI